MGCKKKDQLLGSPDTAHVPLTDVLIKALAIIEHIPVCKQQIERGQDRSTE